MSGITVTAKIMGTPARVLENFTGTTVSDLMDFLELSGNYTVNMAGQPSNKEASLSDGSYVVFAPSVKGARRYIIVKR